MKERVWFLVVELYKVYLLIKIAPNQVCKVMQQYKTQALVNAANCKGQSPSPLYFTAKELKKYYSNCNLQPKQVTPVGVCEV